MHWDDTRAIRVSCRKCDKQLRFEHSSPSATGLSFAAAPSGEMYVKVDNLLKKYDLAQWSFDVLAILRRAGAPYWLSQKALSQSTMLTSSVMVNRLDRLENHGLLRRLPNTIDRRGIIVELTPAGKRIMDRVMPDRLVEAKKVADLLPAQTRNKLILSLKLLSAAISRIKKK